MDVGVEEELDECPFIPILMSAYENDQQPVLAGD
jgi:hypothetical protein